MVVMSCCNNYFTQRLEGWKDLSLFNCSDDVVTIETSLANFERDMPGFYQPDSSESIDTIPLIKRLEYYQCFFITGSYMETGNTLFIILEPGEEMRIIHQEWLISPTKFRERDLCVDNLKIMTRSDTIVARSRKEILGLRLDKKCEDGVHYKTIKYGRHGTPIMSEKVWRGR
jgi:hypothetical protein